MFDLQSLCRNQRQPDWISTTNAIQLEQTAKSVEYLWSKRNIFTYPESNVDVDSAESLYCDLNRCHENIFICKSSVEDIVRFNDLLPPLTPSGELSHLYGYDLSTDLPQHKAEIGRIQVHIQFSDRSYYAIQNTISEYDDELENKSMSISSMSDNDNNDNISKSKIGNSLIYSICLDDLKLDFFIHLFPQLLVTHHLVYCSNSVSHYYYQHYFSSEKNKYEWIQTDIQLIDIYHRYIWNHLDNKNIVLFFQIRPRSDTKSDEESIECHKELLLNNLMQINEIINDDDDDVLFEDIQNEMIEDEMIDDEMVLFEDNLVSNVIAAIHEQQQNTDDLQDLYDLDLCGFCQKKFSTNKRSKEQWIECEFCHKWYHVICSGLTPNDFQQFQSNKNDKNRKYKCLMCQNSN